MVYLLWAYMISGNRTGMLLNQDQVQLGEMSSHPTCCSMVALLQMLPTTGTNNDGGKEVSPSCSRRASTIVSARHSPHINIKTITQNCSWMWEEVLGLCFICGMDSVNTCRTFECQVKKHGLWIQANLGSKMCNFTLISLNSPFLSSVE